ncbi:3-oxo-5-alpha-steroid 4-dehydrogenase-domain-containing protein [Phyllosticta citriasiana]|uniref:Polyprenal reductase n=1 Tax=Phyllosticta citriasiana TaxID=595635 RepID=A0ABR1KYD6_9PEZI
MTLATRAPFLARLEPLLLLRSLFLTAASIVVAVYAIPALRERFLAYGSRATTPRPAPRHASPKSATPLAPVLDRLATYRVPHRWFNHFYLLSVLCSLFWAQQYFFHGPVLHLVVEHAAADPRPAQVPLARIHLAWLLMLAQGLRRLFESTCISKPSSSSSSSSSMWVTHWLLGLFFYAAMSVAVWIEASQTLQAGDPSAVGLDVFLDPQALVGTALFHWTSVQQHRAHAYLASLKKYTLPTGGAFDLVLCPHYSFECVIYLGLAIVAAPEQQWVNKTIICALIFVAANLGVTAVGTREWYEARFGKEAVGKRARMVPFVW